MRPLVPSSICTRGTSVDRIAGPLDAVGDRTPARGGRRGARQFFPGAACRSNRRRGCRGAPRPQDAALPAWIAAANLRVVDIYSVPHGRRYALLGLRR